MFNKSFLSNVCHVSLPTLPAISGNTNRVTDDDTTGLKKIKSTQDPRRACSIRQQRPKVQKPSTQIDVEQYPPLGPLGPENADPAPNVDRILPDLVWYMTEEHAQSHSLLAPWATRWMSSRNVDCIRRGAEMAEKWLYNINYAYIEVEMHAVICSLACGAAVRHPPLRPLALTVGTLKGVTGNQLRGVLTTMGTPLLGNCAPVVLQLLLASLAAQPFRILFPPLPNVQCDCFFTEPEINRGTTHATTLHDSLLSHMPSTQLPPIGAETPTSAPLRARRTINTGAVMEFLFALTRKHAGLDVDAWVSRTRVYRNSHVDMTQPPCMSEEDHHRCVPAIPLIWNMVTACRFIADLVDAVDNSFINASTLIVLFDGQPLFRRDTIQKTKDVRHIVVEGVPMFATQCATERPVNTIPSNHTLNRVTLSLDWVSLPCASKVWTQSTQMELLLRPACATTQAVLNRRFMDNFLFTDGVPSMFIEDVEALFARPAAWNKGPTNNNTLSVWMAVADSVQEWALQAGAVVTQDANVPTSTPNYMMHGESAVHQGHPQWRMEMEILPAAVNEWAIQYTTAVFTVFCDVVSTSAETHKAVRQKLLLNPVLLSLAHIDREAYEKSVLANLDRLALVNRIAGGAVSYVCADPCYKFLRPMDAQRCIHKHPRSVIVPAPHLSPTDVTPSSNPVFWRDGSCTVACKCDGLETVVVLSEQSSMPSFLSFKGAIVPLVCSNTFSGAFRGQKYVVMFAEAIVRFVANELQLLLVPHEVVAWGHRTPCITLTHEQRVTSLFEYVSEWLAPHTVLPNSLALSIASIPLATATALLSKMGPTAGDISPQTIAAAHTGRGTIPVQFVAKRYFSGPAAFRRAAQHMQIMSSVLNISCDGFIITPVAQRIVSVTPHTPHASVKWKPVHTIDFAMARVTGSVYRLSLLNHKGGSLVTLARFSSHETSIVSVNGETTVNTSAISALETTRFSVPIHIDVSQLPQSVQQQLEASPDTLVAELAVHLDTADEDDGSVVMANLTFVRIRETHKQPNVLLSAMDNIASLTNSSIRLANLLSSGKSDDLPPHMASECIRHTQNMVVRKHCLNNCTEVCADFGAGKGGTIDEWVQCAHTVRVIHVVDTNEGHLKEFRRRLDQRQILEACCRATPMVEPTSHLVETVSSQLAKTTHKSTKYILRVTGQTFQFHHDSFMHASIHQSLQFIACFMCLQQAIRNRSELAAFVSMTQGILAPEGTIAISVVDHAALMSHPACIRLPCETGWDEFTVDGGRLLLQYESMALQNSVNATVSESYCRVKWRMSGSQTAQNVSEWAVPVQSIVNAFQSKGFIVDLSYPFTGQRNSAILSSMAIITARAPKHIVTLTDFAWAVSLVATCAADVSDIRVCKYLPVSRDIPGIQWWTAQLPSFTFFENAGLFCVALDHNLHAFLFEPIHTWATQLPLIQPQSVAETIQPRRPSNGAWRAIVVLACLQLRPYTTTIHRFQCLRVYGILPIEASAAPVCHETSTSPQDHGFAETTGSWQLTCVRCITTCKARTHIHRSDRPLFQNNAAQISMHRMSVLACLASLQWQPLTLHSKFLLLKQSANCATQRHPAGNSALVVPTATNIFRLCGHGALFPHNVSITMTQPFTTGTGDGDQSMMRQAHTLLLRNWPCSSDTALCVLAPLACVCHRDIWTLCIAALHMSAKSDDQVGTTTSIVVGHVHKSCEQSILPILCAALPKVTHVPGGSDQSHSVHIFLFKTSLSDTQNSSETPTSPLL